MIPDRYEFVIFEHVIPYVRMTRKGKYVNPRAQAYLANKDVLRLKLKEIMRDKDYDIVPKRTPMKASFSFYRLNGDVYTSDLDNLVKAVCDAMNDLVYPDDRWIDEIEAAKIGWPSEAVTIRIVVKGD